MSLIAWQGRFRFGVGAALALLAGALFAPATARASCGDYVMFGSQGHGASASQRAMPLYADPSRAHGPSPLRAPCSGPACSQQSMPFAPPPATPSVEEERWAFPLTFPFLTEGHVIFLVDNANSSQSIHRPALVYHPPR
jgi:hypothetical protein